MNLKLLKIIFFAAVLLFAGKGANAQKDSRAGCFPFERLAVDERRQAAELLLKALDSEALYTIAGGVKPMSSGFASVQTRTQLPRQQSDEAEKIVQNLNSKKAEELKDDEKRSLATAKTTLERRDALQKLETTRRILETWRCGDEIFADVHHFARAFDGKRFSDGVVFSRPRLKQAIADKADFFSRWAITPGAHPLQVLYAVEYDETAARFGGYGYLFGYPDFAVNFFVAAAQSEEFTGKFVERDFYPIPTFGAQKGDFTYAVPKGHVETEIDKTLKSRAAVILEDYKRRRAEYIGDGKKGVVEMLRDWFCNERGKCSPSNIR